MLKKLALATAALALITSTASADYYIVQEKATKKCKVVETRPTETTWIQIGPAAFKTQSDAEKQVKTVCVEKRYSVTSKSARGPRLARFLLLTTLQPLLSASTKRGKTGTGAGKVAPALIRFVGPSA